MTTWIRRFWQEEDGQSTTEYILILAVVVMIAMKFKGVILGRMEKAAENLGTQIDNALEVQ